MDELLSDRSGFWNNRATLFWMLFNLAICLNLKICISGGARNDPVFCRDYRGCLSFYLLPCLCVFDNEILSIIWAHSRARKRGLATTLLKLLNVKTISNPLPESLEFWEKSGFEFTDEKQYIMRYKENLKDTGNTAPHSNNNTTTIPATATATTTEEASTENSITTATREHVKPDNTSEESASKRTKVD